MSTEEKSAPGSLQRLTVAQLKALCKDQKIAGYSKLGKAALIEKLSAALKKQEAARKDVTGSGAQQIQLTRDPTRSESTNVSAKTQSALLGLPDDAHIVQENVRRRYSERTENGM